MTPFEVQATPHEAKTPRLKNTTFFFFRLNKFKVFFCLFVFLRSRFVGLARIILG